MFPVEEHPVFARVETGGGVRALPVPDKKAIVDVRSGRVVGIVGRDYRLVSNRQALDWAVQCCKTVFPETKPVEWTARAFDAPASGGHCSIDLAHNSATLDFQFIPPNRRPDLFGPFIRVTNSYNGLRALAFDIGYHRKVCSNGLILPKSIIRFKFTHMKREIGETIEFEIAHDQLQRVRASFDDWFATLKDVAVDRAQFEPLSLGVLMIRMPAEAPARGREAFDSESLSQHMKTMCDRYANDLGENAYAIFNVITEFASFPPANVYVRRERHSLQRLAGQWLSDFCHECREPGFSLKNYIGKIRGNNGDDGRLKRRESREGSDSSGEPEAGQPSEGPVGPHG